MRHLAAALLLILPCAAGAQGTIRGVVSDSLLARAPLQGATVVVQGHDGRAVTDRLGRFTLRGVPAGMHMVAFFHPLLDSLEATAPLTRVVVRDGETAVVSLGMPSANSLALANCGRALLPSSAILFGTVRDAEAAAPVTGAVVRANWYEWLVGNDISEAHRVEADTTDADGHFVLCGIPNDIALALTATMDGQTTGDLALDLDHLDIGRRDLMLSRTDTAARIPPPASSADTVQWRRPPGRAALGLTVRGPDGRAVPRAHVGVRGTNVFGSTDAKGHVRLSGAPAGSQTLLIRRPGSVPVTRLIALRSGVVTEAVIDVGLKVVELPTVAVVGQRQPSQAERAIRVRRMSSKGRVYDGSTYDRAANERTFWARVPGVTMKNDHGTEGPLLRDRLGEPCDPVLFVDGAPNFFANGWEIDILLRAAVFFEVYTHSTQRPPEFITPTDCGVIVIWTKGPTWTEPSRRRRVP